MGSVERRINLVFIVQTQLAASNLLQDYNQNDALPQPVLEVVRGEDANIKKHSQIEMFRVIVISSTLTHVQLLSLWDSGTRDVDPPFWFMSMLLGPTSPPSSVSKEDAASWQQKLLSTWGGLLPVRVWPLGSGE